MDQEKQGKPDLNSLTIAEKKCNPQQRLWQKKVLHESEARHVATQNPKLELNTKNLVPAQNCLGLADVFELAPVGLMILDRDGLIKYANQTVAEIVGKEQPLLIQTSLFDYVYGDRGKLIKHLERTQLSGKSDTVNICVRDNKNIVRHVHMYSVVRKLGTLRDSCLSAFVDITEYVQQQQALQLQNTLLEQMQEGVLLVRQKDGIILETNASLDDLFGYEPGELAGHHLSVLTMEQKNVSLTQSEYIIFELRRWGRWTGEIQNVRKDGSGFWSEVSISVFDHQDYGPIWLAVQRDITRRKEAERALLESEQFANAVLDALPLQMAVLDEHTKIVAVNKAWKQFARDCGAPEEICFGIGISYRDICSLGVSGLCGNDGKAVGGIEAVIKGAQSQFLMEYACKLQQESRWYLLKATSRENGNKGAVVTYIDITWQKRTEAMAQAQRDELARVARLKTVGALSSALAHEITQPLTAISCFSDAALSIVKKSDLQATQLVNVLHDINKQVKRAAAIMQRLREFMGQGRAHKIQVDICDIVHDAIQLIEAMAHKHSITIQLRLAEGIHFVNVDRIQIEQVIVNLLTNSIEAICSAPCEKRVIQVETVPRHGQVEILVRDTGPGLNSQWTERIFDLFETNKKTGMGMGLSISRSIVESHHGRLWADSSANLGAVFHVSLPTSN